MYHLFICVYMQHTGQALHGPGSGPSDAALRCRQQSPVLSFLPRCRAPSRCPLGSQAAMSILIPEPQRMPHKCLCHAPASVRLNLLHVVQLQLNCRAPSPMPHLSGSLLSPLCRDNSIGDAGLAALVPALARLPALLQLDLGSVRPLARPCPRWWPLRAQGGGRA